MEVKTRVVREIPALYRPNMQEITSKENVTYYARVSTDMEEQEDSYENQRDYFEQYIKARPDWNYVEGYADQGISGTKAEHRPEFMRMIEDCKKGKINRILVKSISRFARNTVDTLKYIRELKELGVSVFFETQGIDTMTPNGEVLITILAALAEQESRTISTNIKWSYQKRFKEGKVVLNCKILLGYDKVGDEYVIVEDEAEIVRQIYLDYLSGKTIRQIADELNERGIPTKRKSKWGPSVIQSILSNEKYTGNAYLGKTYKPDVLSKRRLKNVGQETMYYVENSHPAIITQEMFDMAQFEKKRRLELRSTVNTGKGKYSSKYPFSGLLVCSECGSKFRRYARTLKNGDVISTWICIQHQKDRTKCKMKPLKEEDILEAYKRVVSGFREELEEVVETTKESIREEFEQECIESVEPIQEELAEIRKTIMELFRDKKEGIITINEYNEKYKVLSERAKELENKEEEINTRNLNFHIQEQKLKTIFEYLDDEKTNLLDPSAVRNLLECIKVINKHNIEFQFKCDVNVEEQI